MHYYQFNIGDYAKKTRHLSNYEDLAYRRLLDLYYDTEMPIITDIKKLSRLISLQNHEEEISNVLEDFFTSSDNGYFHEGIDKEIDIYKSKADIARFNGSKGGRPKGSKSTSIKPRKTQSVNLEKPEITQSVNLEKPPVNLANPEITGSKANQEPLTINQEPLTINQEPLTINQEPVKSKVANGGCRFDEFWITYPKKRDRKKAKDSWVRKNLDLKADFIIADVEKRSVSDAQWLKNYIPLPTTYINGERWEDEYNVKQRLVSSRTIQNAINTEGWENE